MIENIIKDYNYKEIMETHAKDVIGYLLDKNINFSILCNVTLVDFDPKIPEEISKNFKPLTLFVLAGYTFESVRVDDENIYFEAGFGPDNFGSFVTVPLFGVLQVILEETVLFINLTAGTEEFREKQNPKPKSDDEGIKNSMEALLSNPENKKFAKKSKK